MRNRLRPAAPHTLLFGLVLMVGAAGLGAQSMDDFFSEPDETVEQPGADAESPGDEPPDVDADAQADAEDDPDALDSPDAEGHPDAASEPGAVDIDALTTAPTRVSGRVSANAGISLGFNEWPGSDAAADRSIRDLIEPTAGYDMDLGLTVDSRPRPYLRFYTALSSGLSATSLSFSTPSIDSAFVDYTAGDNLFLRAGTYGMGWGRARIFASPGNLVSRVSDGAALRASLPLVGRAGSGRSAASGSITAVAYTIPVWVADWGAGDPRSLAVAGQLERSRGILSTELAAHYQYDEEPQGALTLTAALGTLTLSAEARYALDADAPGLPGADGNRATALASFFWESAARAWSFWGEYSYDADRRDATTGDDGVRSDGMHLVGLAMRAPGLRGGAWRPQLTWRHAVVDRSGQLILGSSGSIAPDLSLSVGIPLYYGRPGTYYRGIAETRAATGDTDDDTLTEQEEDVLRISGENVISLGLGLSISFSF